MANKNPKDIALDHLVPETLEEFQAAADLELEIRELVDAETAGAVGESAAKSAKIQVASQGLESLEKAGRDILAAVQAQDAKMAEEACLRLASAIKAIQSSLV